MAALWRPSVRHLLRLRTLPRHVTNDASARPASRGPPRPKGEPSLLVSEIFKSVQGEGPFTGRPSIFLRLGVCNLSCVWCDTPYTWLFTPTRHDLVRTRVAASTTPHIPLPPIHDKNRELTRRPVSQVTETVKQLAGTSVSNVVITGGEPLLHKKHLLPFVDHLLSAGFSVEFETNGTISPEGLSVHTHLNVSPKLSNSIQPHSIRVNPDVLRACLSFPSSVLKFVVDEQRDVEEVIDIVNDVSVDKHRVFLMPQGSHPDVVNEKGRWLVDVCVEHGFQYCQRAHVQLWGDKRGV